GASAGPRFSAAKGGAETALQGSGSAAATVPAMPGYGGATGAAAPDGSFDQRETQPRVQPSNPPPPLPKS
ncbi:MAG: hypothetical protein JRI23_29585, partial [Deltaproteobacteria bacterium]|nr:hypothetical protein [Deltaproteobacteria bacterium]MBW2536302.1 hypothetical protein [Deltaproteobacteria bacterium]